MFTGIVQGVGTIRAVRPRDGDVALVVDAAAIPLADVQIGDSIAVNGTCLTVTRLESGAFEADVSRETLSMTTLADWRPGTRVNLEPALRAGQALGGHYVTGHVDGVGKVVARHEDARSVRMEFEVPAALARYVARKGSVTIDGVSLTVNGVDGTRFDVNLVPHTLQVTILGDYQTGYRVNLEVDIIARYVERLTSNAGTS